MNSEKRNLSVVGAQWGDEGKGKIVDLLTEKADVVVRYAGGNNAGHTLVVDGRKLVVHLLPSGIIHGGKTCVLGDGMVIDPAGLLQEMSAARQVGLRVDPDCLRIGLKAHLILPYHRELDALREQGPNAIGTTKRGIGPAYEDKAARRGLRTIDLLQPSRFKRRLAQALETANDRIVQRGGKPFASDEMVNALEQYASELRPYLTDTVDYLHQTMDSGAVVLFEGAQGTMLDIDHGTYPFVTSSTTLAGGACSGAGIAPNQVGTVLGVSKAYVTRVGGGPFPSEISDEAATQLRDLGNEFGATTGRPRRCGWLDLPALRHAVRLNGMTHLALTKLDVLAQMPRIFVCVAYKRGDQQLHYPPADADELAAVEPVLEEIAPICAQLESMRKWSDLPAAAQQFVNYLEDNLNLKISLVSVGPERKQTIVRDLPWGS